MKNPDVYFVGCPCHMAYYAARKGEDSFSVASVSSGFDVDDLVVDLYYWFNKGTKRINELRSTKRVLEIAYFVRHDIAEILLKVALKHQKINQSIIFCDYVFRF